ncbi:hypothetical protein [Lentibacillus persicus]|uniref:hypothetical protein n=1 Tax=Lentibacillus persicus TaxID=640948 RepID=UPI001C43659C|nr:hypothetical protein [Lentibacillus persicus]
MKKQLSAGLTTAGSCFFHVLFVYQMHARLPSCYFFLDLKPNVAIKMTSNAATIEGFIISTPYVPLDANPLLTIAFSSFTKKINIFFLAA